MENQPMQGYQPTQIIQLNLFYQPQNDNNIYHITVQNYPWEVNYDYDFNYKGYHVACKLLSHPLIVNMLNKEIYGRDFEVNDLKRKNTLTWEQKLNLEVNLKQDLPFLQDQILNSQPITNVNMNTTHSKQENSQLNDEIRLFYQPPNDNRFYHVNCKIIFQDFLSDYDYEFFYEQRPNVRYHVTCKSLSPTLIINILNKEIYGRDFDVNDLKRDNALTTSQKLNLELNLKLVLPSYLYIPEREMSFDSGSSQYENNGNNESQTVSTVDI
ncbi:hypothetical protein GLOIN_2v1549999 [Rhizophagus clarus]|uniref:Uncharacterized protein n=1 Tax=Rhizophagus clarus TaxID=94130 RepID=A0A8H3M9S4_9GLOM|nr:hypothetical protein GLOIN_2v1549999 [Rhizophagus clarus]